MAQRDGELIRTSDYIDLFKIVHVRQFKVARCEPFVCAATNQDLI